jgi:hypothetical protein
MSLFTFDNSDGASEGLGDWNGNETAWAAMWETTAKHQLKLSRLGPTLGRAGG